MEINSSVPAPNSHGHASLPPSYTSQSNDPYVADLLRVADDNMAKMKDEVTIVQEEKEGLINKVDMYKKQVKFLYHLMRGTSITMLTHVQYRLISRQYTLHYKCMFHNKYRSIPCTRRTFFCIKYLKIGGASYTQA